MGLKDDLEKEADKKGLTGEKRHHYIGGTIGKIKKEQSTSKPTTAKKPTPAKKKPGGVGTEKRFEQLRHKMNTDYGHVTQAEREEYQRISGHWLEKQGKEYTRKFNEDVQKRKEERERKQREADAELMREVEREKKKIAERSKTDVYKWQVEGEEKIRRRNEEDKKKRENREKDKAEGMRKLLSEYSVSYLNNPGSFKEFVKASEANKYVAELKKRRSSGQYVIQMKTPEAWRSWTYNTKSGRWFEDTPTRRR